MDGFRVVADNAVVHGIGLHPNVVGRHVPADDVAAAVVTQLDLVRHIVAADGVVERGAAVH